MKVLARITATLLLIIAVLLLLGGFIYAVLALASPPGRETLQFLGPGYANVLGYVQLGLALGVMFQGLLLAALGEALWLLADVAENSARLVHHR